VSAIALDRGVATEVPRLLRLAGWARLALAQALLLLGPLLPAELVPEASGGVLALAVLAVAASSIGLLLAGDVQHPMRVAGLVAVLDVVLVTAVVAATGGSRSIYTFLYVLAVTGACLLLPRTGAVAIAGLASLLYAGIVVARTVVPLTVLLEAPRETTVLEVLTMFLNAGTFLVVGIVAGGLAEQYRETREELLRQRRDGRDLQAFKAVVLQSVGAGLVVLDGDLEVTALNPAVEEITGVPAAEAIGRPWSHLFGDEALLVGVEAELARDPRSAPRREVQVRRGGGRPRPVRLTFSALRSQERRRLGLVAVCEDLSEIRAMEAQVREADRLATLGRMAANIAHEIRNPLASMAGAIEALTGEALTGNERGQLSEIVHRESARIDGIIREFLEYARPAPLIRTRLDVAILLREILVLVEHRPVPAPIRVVRDLPEALWWEVDPQQLRQAVWNLCLNALDAMPGGGELRVAARADGRALRITVTDTGTGIPESERPHVFEPFYSTKPGGSGLGLPLVHRVARDHGGSTELRSVPGAGTEIVLTFHDPRARPR
jgi:two-component system sensor histidine kinase PilS (NtrC family)